MIVVNDSAIHSRGVFTTQACPKDAPLFRVDGRLLTQHEAEYCEREENNYYIYRLADDQFIDASQHPFGRYVNHSCDPNLETAVIDGGLFLVAARDIEAGEELTLDYEYPEIYALCRCSICRQPS